MHEGTIAREIIRTAREEAKKAGMKKIARVKVVIGEMHAVVDEALRFLFDIMKEEEGLGEAVLEIEKKPVEVKCKICGEKFHPEDPVFVCPSCGSIETQLITGDEMYIESLEGEK